VVYKHNRLMWGELSQNGILSESPVRVRTNKSCLGRFLRDTCPSEVPSWFNEKSSFTQRHVAKNCC